MTPDATKLSERVYTIWGGVLILWALYRAFVFWPEVVDEFIIKPLLFVIPVVFYVLKIEKRQLASIGVAIGKFTRDMYLGVAVGVLFLLEGLLTNILKHGTISIAPVIPMTVGSITLTLFISLAAAFCEELLVRGFFYTRLKEAYQNEAKAFVFSTLMYLLILIPVVFTRLHLTGTTLAIFVVSNLVLSSVNTFIFRETKTLTVPVLVHTFWNMVVLLYL